MVINMTKTIQLTSGLHVSAVKQPSSGQSRTQSRYIKGLHSMGSHTVHTFYVPRLCSTLA
jgi:hypothetical protein